jgi:hypothetical protein
LTCKCSSRFPSRLPCSRYAQCLHARKAHLGVPTNQMVALLAAIIRGNNAGRTLQSIPIAPPILGTAAQGTRVGVSEIRSPNKKAPQERTGPVVHTKENAPTIHRPIASISRRRAFAQGTDKEESPSQYANSLVWPGLPRPTGHHARGKPVGRSPMCSI